MKAQPTEPGRVVLSTQGHDKGRWYAVLSVLDERFVSLCDGRIRTLAKPKKKQLKHLQALPMTIEVTGKGASGGALNDSDIRASLSACKEAYLTQTGYAPNSAHDMKEEPALVQE